MTVRKGQITGRFVGDDKARFRGDRAGTNFPYQRRDDLAKVTGLFVHLALAATTGTGLEDAPHAAKLFGATEALGRRSDIVDELLDQIRQRPEPPVLIDNDLGIGGPPRVAPLILARDPEPLQRLRGRAFVIPVPEPDDE